MTAENEKTNAASELERATLSLKAANVLMSQELFDDAVSDAYFAAFHAARALLFSRGLETKTHGGVRHLLNVNFVRTQILAADQFAAFDRMQYDRASADYAGGPFFNREQAAQAVEQATQFVAAVTRILKTAPQE